jgi:hypothetical protein
MFFSGRFSREEEEGLHGVFKRLRHKLCCGVNERGEEEKEEGLHGVLWCD